MKLPPYLFWVEWVKRTVWEPFWWIILSAIILWIPFLRVWWWIFLPLMLVVQLKTLYIWWLDWDYAYAKTHWVMLEIIPPRENLVPWKAMEDVFSVVWPMVSDAGNFRDRWIDGMLENGPWWCSWEIVSIEGKIHFYVRARVEHVLGIETAIYAHYPDVEIHQAVDYVTLVPPTAPNDEWDVYGEDWDLKRDDAIPIKTYEKFFEPQGEKISAEEKRLDPMISLLESLSRLGPGEHYWVQFITCGVHDGDEPDWKKTGEKLINKIIKRPTKKDPTFLEDVWYLAKMIVLGPEKEGSGDKVSYSWAPQQKEESGERELLVTPGEREKVTEIENKMKKPVFRTTIRGVYAARREVWSSAHKIILRSYMAHFLSDNLNYFMFVPKTRPKVNYFMRQRRVFLRSRRMYRNAILRFTPMFPSRGSDMFNSILNVEELATLFHFPLRITGMVSPTLEKVESKKSGPPPNLPVG